LLSRKAADTLVRVWRAGLSASTLAAAVVVALAPGSARAEPTTPELACGEAFSTGPEASKAGKLVAARAALLRCSAAPCPASMRPLCAEDLRRLEERIPTVVFIAKGPHGEDVADARVLEQGQVVVESLDGKSVPLDPGPHAFRFEQNDGTIADATVVLHEGERARAITVTLARPEAVAETPPAPPAVPPPEPSRPVPWTVFAAGGLTVASAASFGIFGVRGVALRSDLSGCKGSCSAASVDRVTTSYTIANVSLGVAAGALVLTAILYFTRPDAPPASAVLAPEGPAWAVATF
jgi:hypothetical protein